MVVWEGSQRSLNQMMHKKKIRAAINKKNRMFVLMNTFKMPSTRIFFQITTKIISLYH